MSSCDTAKILQAKVILIGAAGVGKSCLAERFVNGGFNEIVPVCLMFRHNCFRGQHFFTSAETL